jgi:hypothetical protein
MAAIIFWFAVALSLLSLWLLRPLEAYSWITIIVSALFNGWSLYQSDHGGFVKTRHAPRAHEPPRHFTPLQVVVIEVLLMGQIGGVIYLVVNRSALNLL